MSKPPHHQRIPRPEGNIGIGIQETRVGSTNPANSVATTVSTTSTVSSTNTNSKMEYIGVYKIGPEIGKGSFATVYKCINTTNNKAVAIKSVYRSKLKSKKLIENLEIEILILKNMKHPHIVGLLDYKQTSSYFHLVMDYCSMGDLSYFIRRRNQLVKTHPVISSLLQRYPSPEGSHGLNEVLVLHFLKQLSSALSFLRSKSLVHRDIKPQNLLLCPPVHSKQEFIDREFVGLWELPILKIADFGFARFLPSTSMAETLCGSPLYMAPEILRYEKYNAKADLWSVGAVLYEMTVGKPPFKAGNHIELLKNIEKANDRIKFPSAAQVPESLKSLIKSLLKYNPTERISFNEFFSHPLITGDLEETDEPLETSEMDENLFISEYISPIKPSERSQFINPIPLTPIVNQEEQNKEEEEERTQNIEVEETIKRPVMSPSPKTDIPSSSTREDRLTNDNSKETQKDDSVLDKDYVVVERKEIIDDIFDKLPTTTSANTTPNEISSGAPRQRRTSSTGSNRRPSFTERKISISPTNALSKALFLASHKLFGTNATNQQQSTNSSTPVSAIAENVIDDDLIYGSGSGPSIAVTAIVSTPENDDMVLLRLEMLANMAHSVKTLADVKYKQVIPSPPSSDTIEDEEEIGLPDEIVKKIAEDGMKLYDKALSLLAKGMNISGKCDSQLYDVCLQRFQILSEMAPPVVTESSASADVLLYQRAIQIARESAISEINRKDVKNCLISYSTAYYMLLSVLESEDLSESEVSEIKKIVDKILNRIHMLNK